MATKQTYAQKYAKLFNLASKNKSKTQNELIEIAQKKGYGFRKNEMRQLIREVKAGSEIQESKLTNPKLRPTITKKKIPGRLKKLREVIGSSNIKVTRYATKNYAVPIPNDEDSWVETAEKCYKGFKRLIKRRGKLKGNRSYRKFVLNAVIKADDKELVISSDSFTDRTEFPTFDELYFSWLENLMTVAQSLTEDILVYNFWIGFTEYEDLV
jgi:hypothetical protein